MQTETGQKQTMSLQVTNNLKVTVIPNQNHDYLMSTEQVALGYGVSYYAVRKIKPRHEDEFVLNKHFINGETICPSDPHNKVYWTKRGIVRLGFFIKSERAKLFRDWAEDLVINQVEKRYPSKPVSNAETRQEFRGLLDVVESAAIVCGSHNKLGERLGVSPAVFSHIVRRPWLVSDNMVRALETGCRNITSGKNTMDVEAIEALIKVEDSGARLTLFNKMKKGGLL